MRYKSATRLTLLILIGTLCYLVITGQKDYVELFTNALMLVLGYFTGTRKSESILDETTKS